MNKVTVIFLIVLLVGTSVTVVLWTKPSGTKDSTVRVAPSFNNLDEKERKRTNTLSEKIIVSSVSSSANTGATDQIEKRKINKNVHIFPIKDNPDWSVYRDEKLKFYFRFPSALSLVDEINSGDGKGAFLRFEGGGTYPGYIIFGSSNGEYFRGQSNIPETELGYTDWWKEFETYYSKVISKKTVMDPNEKIVILNRKIYLQTVYFNLGGGNYQINLTTYKDTKKYSFVYSFPAEWHNSELDEQSDVRTEALNQIKNRTVPEPSLSKIRLFDSIVETLQTY
jgi:hypothetical protein